MGKAEIYLPTNSSNFTNYFFVRPINLVIPKTGENKEKAENRRKLQYPTTCASFGQARI